MIEGKDILVTGGCGSIGSEIVRQIIQLNPKRVRIFDHDEKGHFNISQEIQDPKIRHLIGDIRDKDRLLRAMDDVHVVFHAAALKHVPFCEYNPYEAVYSNVIGTKNLVDAAIEKGVEKVVGISTDKAVNPINTMGATKMLSERLIINAPVGTSKVSLAAVRFGNVLGSSGSVIPIFLKQIKKGGPVTITDSGMTRFFMTIQQAVSLVLEAYTEMKGRELYILKMQSVKIEDLAKTMIQKYAAQYGYTPEDIEIKYTGIRPGEKLHEDLFTPEEMPFITESEKMYVLRNSPFDNFASDFSKKFKGFRSSECAQLTQKEISTTLDNLLLE